MSSRLGSRVEVLERVGSSEEPCCSDVAYKGDSSRPYAPHPSPICSHGRPWLRITVYYDGDDDERD